MVSWIDNCHLTGVVKVMFNDQTFQLLDTAVVQSKGHLNVNK